LGFDCWYGKLRHLGRGRRPSRGWFRGGRFRRALETPPKFCVSVGAGTIIILDRNLFKQGGEFRGAPVIARANGKVEEAFQDWGMAWCAHQYGFEQVAGFLRQSVAGKQIDVGQSLRNVALRFFIE